MKQTKDQPKTTPDWPTAIRARMSDGRLLGVDGSVWLYRSVPLGPIIDATSPADAVAVGDPVSTAFEELSAITSTKINRRSASRGSYRQVHIVSVNIPDLYRPPPGHLIAGHLNESFASTRVDRRVLLFGVKLRDKIGLDHGFRHVVESVVQTLVSGTSPLSDFDADYEIVDSALSRSGLRKASSKEMATAAAWWNYGTFPDTPVLVHGDHLHVFSTVESVRIATTSGTGDCTSWPAMADQHAVTFAAVADFDLPFIDATEQVSWWGASLIDSGAVVVSIRGGVEPARITRSELRRHRKQFSDDIRERFESGKMERSEQDEMLEAITQVEAEYAANGTPTLTEASVVVGFDGIESDVIELGRELGLSLNTLMYRQHEALKETFLCSSVRANPHLHDLPSQAIAYSGLGSLSIVGDMDGALVGFTERDKQPAYLSPTAASRADGLPICLGVGATGSGKTFMMLWLADQYARMGHPVVIVDPKMSSDHEAAVRLSGGQVASLDNLVTADGVFDPLRFARSVEAGVEMASSMLLSVNPWGTKRDDYETPLIHALSYGVQNGGTCIGEALQISERAGHAPAEMVQRVFDLAEASPSFHACVGVRPATQALRAAEGITLIKVGDAHLDLPEPGSIAGASQQQRVSLALVRMMVFGSAMALSGRGGVVMLDEAWVFLGAGRSEVERLGRLARSQNVLPMLFTQRVSDALDAGLTGYISRGLILPIADEKEAAAACRLFGLEPTQQRISRITAKATIGGSDGGPGAANWSSMRHLRDPVSGETLRGAVAIYADLSGRAIPVEVTIPPWFARQASTNPDDIARRAGS